MILVQFVLKYKYVVLALVCIGAAFFTGRRSVNPETKTVTVVQTQTVVQHAEDTDIKTAVEAAQKEWQQNQHIVVHTITIHEKNGTTIIKQTSDTQKSSQSTTNTVDTTTDASKKVVDTTTQTKTDTTTTTKVGSEEGRFSAGAVVQLDKWNDLNSRSYELVGGVRVLGPLWIQGGWNIEKKAPSLGLSISF